MTILNLLYTKHGLEINERYENILNRDKNGHSSTKLISKSYYGSNIHRKQFTTLSLFIRAYDDGLTLNDSLTIVAITLIKDQKIVIWPTLTLGSITDPPVVSGFDT